MNNEKGKNLREKNGQWKGKSVGYTALHGWVNYNLEKPQTCRDCNRPKKLELANISQEYKRDLSDWEWLCRKCHMKKDGRLEKLIANSKVVAQIAVKNKKRDKSGKFI